MHTESQDTSL